MSTERIVGARASGPTSHAAFRRIVVRAPNWIGDAVMCEPALRGLRSLFPQAELTLLAKPAIAELFVAYPGLTRVVVYEDKGPHAGLSGKWTLAGTLRRHHFDLAVLFQNAFEAALLSWLAGIPRRYGYATDGRVFFLTDPVAVPDRDTLRHQVHYYWDLLRPLGLTGDPASPMLILSHDEERAIDRRLAEAGIAATDLILGINPGSTYGGAKRWLPERFAETAARWCREIEQQRGRAVSVIILGAKGEEALGQAVADRLAVRALSLSGRTTIRELMAATKRCALLLTNDTGPMHIAAAFGVPVVAVFGPTDWRTTAPYGQEQGIVRQPVECAPCLLRECPIDHRCMTGVTVDQVYETAIKRFAGQGTRGEGREGVHADLAPVAGHTPLAGVTVFLDRDGTLNPDPGYIRSPEQFELFPGVPEALARLTRAGARLVLVTNQSGIGRGYFSVADLEQIHAKLRRLVGEAGVSFEGIYFCPHHPDEACHCRKPEPGMVEQAVKDLDIDLSRSYFIGDHAKDMELARRIGARRVLVETKVHGSPEEDGKRGEADVAASSLSDAAGWILADAAGRQQPSAIGDQPELEPSKHKLTADS